MSSNHDLGERIKLLREDRGFSQEEVARFLGISTSLVENWETDEEQPSIDQALQISKLFNVQIGELLADSIKKESFASEQTKNGYKNRKEKNDRGEKTRKNKALVISLITLAIIGCGVIIWVFFGEKIRNHYRTLSPEEVYQMVSPGTVEIRVRAGGEERIGTGFFIDYNTVVTNFHVIEGCTSCLVFVKNKKEGYNVTILDGWDKDLDLALLRIGYSSKSLIIREEPLTVGEAVYCIGSSQGLTDSFSSGVVAAAERVINDRFYIQITAPISPGNSGGPLVDRYGNVVGITSAGIRDGQNLNLAIPIGDIKKIDERTSCSIYDFYKQTNTDRDPSKKTAEEIIQEVQLNMCVVCSNGPYGGYIHRLTCEKMNTKEAIVSYEKEYFGSLKEALEAGYPPTKTCHCLDELWKPEYDKYK